MLRNYRLHAHAYIMDKPNIF